MATSLLQTLLAAAAAGAPTVIESPEDYDTFTLDGMVSPGKSEISSGGSAKEKVEDQQQLLTRGANTVVRGTVNAVTTYKLTLFTIDQLNAWKVWEKMFLEGKARTPKPRVYQLQDLRYSWVGRVIFEEMTPQATDKPGGPWSRTLTLHQYNSVSQYGGPIRVTSADKEIAAQQIATNAAADRLKDARAAADAARRAGK